MSGPVKYVASRKNPMTWGVWIEAAVFEHELSAMRREVAEMKRETILLRELVAVLKTGHYPACGVGEGTHEGPCDCAAKVKREGG